MSEFLSIKNYEGTGGAFKILLGEDLKEKIFLKRKEMEMTEKQIQERRQKIL